MNHAYHLLQDIIDDRCYIILAVEPGSDGPYETDERAEKDKKIGLKAGRYIRVRRDSRKPNQREEFELLKKFADFHFPPVTIEDLNTKVVFDDRHYLNDELKEMFFKLDLIRSYGSGIRRAKKAMEDNKSPKLVYSPDNDTDDYTQVVAYINKEFARIQEEENWQAGTREIIMKDGLLLNSERSLKEV